jgi:hypothetical protein
MGKDDAVAQYSRDEHIPMRITQELREFFRNPPKHEYSVALEEAISSVIKLFGAADENNRRAIVSRLSSRARNGSGRTPRIWRFWPSGGGRRNS